MTEISLIEIKISRSLYEVLQRKSTQNDTSLAAEALNNILRATPVEKLAEVTVITPFDPDTIDPAESLLRDWRARSRPGNIPKTLRALEIDHSARFMFAAQFAPPGKLWERIGQYISLEKRRSRNHETYPEEKTFIRQTIQGGIRVQRGLNKPLKVRR